VFIPAVFAVLVSFVPVTGMFLFYRFISDFSVQLTSKPLPKILPTVFSLIFLLPGVFAVIVTWVNYLKWEVVLTDMRLVLRAGMFSRKSGELPLASVETMFISESAVGRAFGYGTVVVSSVGGMHFPLAYLPNPQLFYAELQKAVAAAKLPKAAPPPRREADDSRFMPKF
jgi:uncharacterized membrane protein YdbT with pleckstrin-like domain